MALLEVRLDDPRIPGTCRSCGAPIEWGTLRKSGKRMPFNAIVPVRTFADDDRRVVVVVDSTVSTSHFATCPQAHAWRRPS
jgi:hypothetical protein